MSSDSYRIQSTVGTSTMTSTINDSGYKVKGEVFWVLSDSVSGKIESGHINNIVTLDAGILIARLMKSTATANVSGPKFGVYALAVGTGDDGWPNTPPAATVSQRSLFNEVCRKAASSVSFIKDNAISLIPTNVLDFTFTFSESEAVSPLKEMGLIGGDVDTNMNYRNPIVPSNGTYSNTVDLTGKDTLCNYVTFPVINKPSTSTLTWTWRLTF